MHNHKKEELNKTHRENLENLLVRLPPSAPWASALILVVFAPPRSFFGVTLCGMCGSIQSILCNKKDFADIRPGHPCYWASLSSRCVKGKACAGPTTKLTATLHNKALYKTINNDKERVENEAAWVRTASGEEAREPE